MDYDVRSHLRQVKDSLSEDVCMVAISKFHPKEHIMAAYEEGQRVFGESHEQELARKHESLPADIIWHFIGHLQTNKVRFIVPYISMIESVDSIKLMREMNKQAAKIDRVIDILIELHIAEEETKYGFTPDACRQLFVDGQWREMTNIRIRGLMMMASNTDDEAQIRSEFLQAKELFDEIKANHFAADDSFNLRSWGMSDDYPIACQCGSNMVRVGTLIFGPRVY